MNPNLMMGKVDIGNQPVTKNELNTFNQSLVKPASTNPVANTTPGTFTGATSNTNFVSTPTVVSNYGMQNKVADITTDYYKYTNKNPTPQQQVEQTGQVNTPSIDFSTLPFTQDANGVKKYFNQETGAYDLFGPSGQTTEYRGFTVPTDTLSDPYSKSTYDNAAQARAQNKQALADQLEAIAKRYEGYRRTQQQLTESGASGVQNALLQSGAGGRGSVAQYAAATADARVKTIMEDGQRAIEQLGLKEQELVSAAHSAYEAEDWKILGEINSQIEKVRREQIEASSVINKKIAEEQIEADALRKQTLIDNSIAEIYSSGITDTGEIMRKMREAGVLVTSKQVKDTLSNIASGLNTDTNGLDQTTKEFYRLKQVNGLPSYISSLGTEGEQLLAYVRARTGAETKGRVSASSTSGGGGTSPTTYKSDLDFLIDIAKGNISTKFGQETFQNTINKSRNDTDKISAIAAQVVKGLPATERTDFTNQTVAMKQIDKAIDILDTGVKTGVLQSGKQYVYNTFGKDYDPKLSQINQLITSAIQPYRSSITGAAWGDQEDQEYQQLFGSTKYSPAELKQRLEGIKEIMKDKTTNALRASVDPLSQQQNIFDITGNQHLISQGDTLNDLASKYGTTVDVLKALNPGINERNLIVGSSLNLPVENVHKVSSDPLNLGLPSNRTFNDPLGIR